MKKIIKGSYGYLKNKRKQMVFQTVLFFAISLALFVAGYVKTGTKQNPLTIVAVLGCLPACKSLVNTIMYLRAKGCDAQTMERIRPVENRLVGMYDMYFTSYQKNYPISHMVVQNKIVLGLMQTSGCDCKACQDHLTTMLKQGGFKEMTVSITDDLSRYCEQLSKLNESGQENDPVRDDEVRTVLYEISL